MEKYWEIAKENAKHNLAVHTGISILLLCLSPLVLGVKNLTAQDTAKVLEMYVALIGIILLPPIFLPEQNPDIRDLIRSKYTKITVIYSIRAAEAILVLGILLGAYLGMLSGNGCQMDPLLYFAGTLSEMMFMGGIGILCCSLFDSLIAGYMVPVFYYITAMGSGQKYLQVFYPFAMSAGNYSGKWWLFGGGILMITAGIWLRGRK